MKNTITQRIVDFLKDFPPFFLLSKEDIYTIASAIQVIYFENKEVVFKTAATLHQHFYIVKDGAIGLYSENKTLIDQCDEGDIFGLRAFIQNDNYALDAIAIEESILYAIPLEIFKETIANHSKAQQFIQASYASNLKNNSKKRSIAKRIYESTINSYNHVQNASITENPITCLANESIKTAANIMKQHNIGSILIASNNKPIGIVTDKDFRNKIATGLNKIDENVSSIMSSPVITFPRNVSVTDCQIAMLKYGISHLCITEDGTINSDITGIISEHDILVNQSNNPAVIIKEIKRCNDILQLKDIRKKAEHLLESYLAKQVPIKFLTSIISEINTAITHKIIKTNIDKIDSVTPVSFAWLAIGSQGRKEQLLLSDQDNALVFNDSNCDSENREYFINLANSINNDLALVGFEKCPANMMASNPKWCLSVTEWKSQFDNWIIKPTEEKILLSNIFFDYQLIYGDEKLVTSMSTSIFNAIEKNEIFLNYLGRNALQNPPPLSFFRNFLVEDSGEHQNEFDIKLRAIMPLVDAARVLVLSHQTKSINNTIERFEKLGQLEPQNKDIYDTCIDAFKTLLQFRTKIGLQNNTSGRFINIDDLTKSDRLLLKNTFTAVKEIQELIRTRFKLAVML